MTGRHFIKVIIPVLSIAYAGEVGCPVDLTAKAPPCGPALREHLQGTATDEMQDLEETEFDSRGQNPLLPEEAYDLVPQKPHSMKRKTPAPVKSPEKSKASPPAEDDLGEDE